LGFLIRAAGGKRFKSGAGGEGEATAWFLENVKLPTLTRPLRGQTSLTLPKMGGEGEAVTTEWGWGLESPRG